MQANSYSKKKKVGLTPTVVVRHKEKVGLTPAIVVRFITSQRSRHVTNLTDYGCFRFALIQLMLLDHLASMTVITTQHVVGDNCESKPLSSPISAIPEDHAPLY